MNPNGTFYRISENLFGFPSTATALLKYKKHEWIIIAFEKDKRAELIWLNKGFDRSGVSPYLPVGGITETAKRENLTSNYKNYKITNKTSNCSSQCRIEKQYL